jgi:hypothetical protein
MPLSTKPTEGSHRGTPSSKRHTASGKIMIAGQFALIVAAVFAGAALYVNTPNSPRG